jgi:hypothetical protein
VFVDVLVTKVWIGCEDSFFSTESRRNYCGVVAIDNRREKSVGHIISINILKIWIVRATKSRRRLNHGAHKLFFELNMSIRLLFVVKCNTYLDPRNTSR